MTPEQVNEAQELLRSHSSLRYHIARNEHRYLQLYAPDDDENTGHCYIPATISSDVLFMMLALVETKLRVLGVTPEEGLDRECFECGGSGKVPIR